MTKNLLSIIAVCVLTAGSATAQCLANFTWSQSQPNVIDFTNNSVPANPNTTYYNWNFGDNNYGWTVSGPISHTYGAPGTYVACIDLVDSANMIFCSFCDTITVTGTLLCNLTLTTNNPIPANCQNCNDGVATAFAANGTPPYSYLWSNGDTNWAPQNLLPGIYSCCVTDANGCVACDTVQVNAAPPANCGVTFWPSFMSGGQVVFTASTSNVNSNHTISWDFGDLTQGSGTYAWHQYAQSGAYYVCATVYDSLNQCQATYCDTVMVTVTSAPCLASFYVQMDSVNSNQAWIYNLSQGSPSMTYQWFWGDNTTDTAAYPSHIYQMNGTYNICLVVVDAATQCTDTLCQYIQVMRLSQQAALSPLYVNVLPPIGTGIDEAAATSSWSLYPNPANSILTVGGSFSGRDQYMITDLTGRTVATGTLGFNTIDVSGFAAGTFVFTIVKANGQAESKRFVRE